MVHSVHDQNSPMANPLEAGEGEKSQPFIADLLMNELGMGPKELPKANRLVRTLETTLRRHIPFESYTDLLSNLPEDWKVLAEVNGQDAHYQERVKQTFPLLQELIQQDQLDRNFDILYTEEALAMLEGFFKAVKKLQNHETAY